MSWLFGRRSLSASREKIQSNWGNGFIEQLQKKSKQFQESASKQQEYINKLEKVVEAADLKAEGVEVINCTPGSALTCFPMGDLEQELAI